MTDNSEKHTRAVWEQFWDEKSELAKVYSPSERIIRNLKTITDLTGKRILEVGAGTGRTSLQLNQLGAQIVILDYAEKAVQLIKEVFLKFGQSVNIVRADAFHLPVKDNVIDIVFHQGLLEHFQHPQAILKENFRVLRLGGIALVDVPQKFHVYTLIKRLLIWLNAWFAGWETEYTIGQLRTLLEGAGFKIVRCYGDWMRPSLGYRICREIMLKVGITLPLYPQGPRFLRKIRNRLRTHTTKCPLAIYTYLDIGVIAKKD